MLLSVTFECVFRVCVCVCVQYKDETSVELIYITGTNRCALQISLRQQKPIY